MPLSRLVLRRGFAFAKNGNCEQVRRSRFVAKANGGGGSRTPVRKALRPEAYMLIAFDLFRRLRLERARRVVG